MPRKRQDIPPMVAIPTLRIQQLQKQASVEKTNTDDDSCFERAESQSPFLLSDRSGFGQATERAR